MAGLTAAHLKPEMFASRAKHAELRALLAAFEAHLETRRLADAAAVYEEALRHPDACPVRPDDVTLELPGSCRAPLERRFLDGLPGDATGPGPSRLPAWSRPGGSSTSARRSSRSPPRRGPTASGSPS